MEDAIPKVLLEEQHRIQSGYDPNSLARLKALQRGNIAFLGAITLGVRQSCNTLRQRCSFYSYGETTFKENHMKRFKILITLMVFAMGSYMVYAGDLSSNLVGKWFGGNETAEFLKDGLFVAIQGERKATGKYAIRDGNILSISVQGKEGLCKASIEGNKLIFSREYDCPWSGETLTRVK